MRCGRAKRAVGWVLASRASVGGVWASEASCGGVPASEASFPPEASQVVAEGDGLRVSKYLCILSSPEITTIQSFSNFNSLSRRGTHGKQETAGSKKGLLSTLRLASCFILAMTITSSTQSLRGEQYIKGAMHLQHPS